MVNIGPTSQLLAIIREQIGESRIAQGAKHGNTKSGNTSKPDKAQRLFELTAKRIKTISKEDPKRNKKAFKFFLESMMLADFGEELINDPAFYQLIEQVQLKMEQDPQLSAQIEEAGQHLLTMHGE